jgi:uncharacterized protein (DUF924 family)
METMLESENVLCYWLGVRGNTPPDTEQRGRWFAVSSEVDGEVRERFGAAVEERSLGDSSIGRVNRSTK